MLHTPVAKHAFGAEAPNARVHQEYLKVPANDPLIRILNKDVVLRVIKSYTNAVLSVQTAGPDANPRQLLKDLADARSLLKDVFLRYQHLSPDAQGIIQAFILADSVYARCLSSFTLTI
ncbi:hypothetical protein MD484_g6009, partial [Candolleomyces efflorescens]